MKDNVDSIKITQFSKSIDTKSELKIDCLLDGYKSFTPIRINDDHLDVQFEKISIESPLGQKDKFKESTEVTSSSQEINIEEVSTITKRYVKERNIVNHRPQRNLRSLNNIVAPELNENINEDMFHIPFQTKNLQFVSDPLSSIIEVEVSSGEGKAQALGPRFDAKIQEPNHRIIEYIPAKVDLEQHDKINLNLQNKIVESNIEEICEHYKPSRDYEIIPITIPVASLGILLNNLANLIPATERNSELKDIDTLLTDLMIQLDSTSSEDTKKNASLLLRIIEGFSMSFNLQIEDILKYMGNGPVNVLAIRNRLIQHLGP